MPLIKVLSNIRNIYKVNLLTSKKYLTNNWFTVSTVVITGLNRPNDLKHLMTMMDEDIESMTDLPTYEKKLQFKAKIISKQRDTIFKGQIAYGIPKAINALGTLYDLTPIEVRDILPTSPIRPTQIWQKMIEQRRRGRELFDKIYHPNPDKVMNELNLLYPDLHQLCYDYGYGYILSEPSVISDKETSLILLTGCLSQQVIPQLNGHIRGALHNGVSHEELEQVYDATLSLFEHYQIPPPERPITPNV
ncbi:uncharacterized protein BX664DRAFT_381904 [Halteromyces radiatus]|uniref:uncharacterized protein n=1 Tax=Halteromyces radiatus TaxID=101107 RepID=UPI0022207580|nr:uncharacterized protein BX664DRAFT_381904 [Halteromyces radiatus]KAI8099340.1 hypothetical protein BX664DRAFT_381904 [Halteromyces radiatus]